MGRVPRDGKGGSTSVCLLLGSAPSPRVTVAGTSSQFWWRVLVATCGSRFRHVEASSDPESIILPWTLACVPGRDQNEQEPEAGHLQARTCVTSTGAHRTG